MGKRLVSSQESVGHNLHLKLLSLISCKNVLLHTLSNLQKIKMTKVFKFDLKKK